MLLLAAPLLAVALLVAPSAGPEGASRVPVAPSAGPEARSRGAASGTSGRPERSATGAESRGAPSRHPADPVATVREAEQRVRAALEAGRGVDALGPLAAEYVDYQELARRSLGKHWARRSKAERASLVAALRALLEAAYLTRLAPGATGQADVRLVRLAGAEAELHVVATSGAQQVPLELRLRRGQDGRWRVYDATVGGLALLEGYQEQLPQLLELGGMERLLRQLESERQAQLARVQPAAPSPPR
jgi:ABC-type transporter MlaC component